MQSVARLESGSADVFVDIVVIGAGAAGLVAAMRAREAGATVLVLERDSLPRGSTALSAGLIPAAGTRFQKAAKISDSEALFAEDIRRKAHGEADETAIAAVVGAIAPALEWLSGRHALPFSVIENFTYPGHSANRMHGLPSRSGSELMDRLRAAAEAAEIDILTEARAETLLRAPQNAVGGVRFSRPDGTSEEVRCGAVILACNGYGGNPARVARHIPELASGIYFGHPGNQGDALAWGEALGARTAHLSGHQGHGSVAHPQGILITWATMTEGGFQVNRSGARFSDESRGYSEQAEAVLAQPEGLAWSVFDERIAEIARQFEDFRQAEAHGAVLQANAPAELAGKTGLPAGALEQSLAEVRALKAASGTDAFGRTWTGLPQLEAPFRAVRVTGALFHTQGGLVVDEEARVLGENGLPIAGLFAVGGAACGVSGSKASGYLSGNGLLTAVAYGYLAGAAAARSARSG
ncbi:MAG: FAD-dependent oxidoreductase [Methylocystis sp.]|nr:FAD-dependent oxidoreductase [Methylocystis sp.]MCA3584089.1 FAD-dependent oxidoreductase [Methylocystis sp.]MCA3588951.1 FAD-dependent oxidoreductase [Methylocystis sp.]MCA3591209.1 FAD-dependent oxidoreductase [Methylocystis sp.]